MSKDDRGEVHPFPATPWSLVGLAGQVTSEGQRRALGLLLTRYMPALRTFLILDRRLDPDKADDVLQGFIASKVLEQGTIRQSDRSGGKFRTFLLRTLRNFMVDQYRYDHAARRSSKGGSQEDVSDRLDLTSDEAGPSESFDKAWAREVIDEAVKLVRAECKASNRSDVWAVFESRILKPSLQDAAPTDYDALVEQLGLDSPQQATNLLVTAKRMFARALRSVVSEYAEPDGVEDEVRDLKAIVARKR